MGNDQSSSHRRSSTSSVQQQTSSGVRQPAPAPSGPGAYNVSNRDQRFYVTVPRGIRPGQHFAVLVNGQQMMVRCPPDNREGDRLVVTAPRQQSHNYVVTVPPNVRPGEQFRVMINNQEVMVTCPPNVRPSQRVTFQLPQQLPQRDQQQHPAPNHQMFEVTVPEGVSPGETFALLANGQRVMVTCPNNVRPGAKVRFQLPMQLSKDQLEAIRVDHATKDGWIRCLGQDLKFHWVYNKTSPNDNNNHSYKIPFDIDARAFVRQIIPPTKNDPNGDIQFMKASDYAVMASVAHTTVNYQEISTVSSMTFTQKTDWLKRQFSVIRTPYEEGHIKIKVRRESLLQDSMEGMESIKVADMHKYLRFEFIGEPGLDAGGVAREWYALVSEQLFNPDCGLFTYSAVNQMCMQINPNSDIANEYHLRYFHFAGRVLGKALMDAHICPVHLVQPIYKHLMGWPVTLRDLEHIDEEVYRHLIDLLDMDDISILYLDFSVTEDRLGLTSTVNLVDGGDELIVDNDNISQYLEEQLKYRLLKRVKLQTKEFLRGFYDVVPEPLLAVFNFQELELLLHGLPNINMEDWMAQTDYSGEFLAHPKHKVIGWFWEIVGSYSQENKAKLLQFTTGTCGVPAQGFAFLQGNDGNIRKFTLHGDKNVKIFPRSHTCFNRLDMPLYSSKQDMQKYLTMAITYETTGFDIE